MAETNGYYIENNQQINLLLITQQPDLDGEGRDSSGFVNNVIFIGRSTDNPVWRQIPDSHGVDNEQGGEYMVIHLIRVEDDEYSYKDSRSQINIYGDPDQIVNLSY